MINTNDYAVHTFSRAILCFEGMLSTGGLITLHAYTHAYMFTHMHRRARTHTHTHTQAHSTHSTHTPSTTQHTAAHSYVSIQVPTAQQLAHTTSKNTHSMQGLKGAYMQTAD